MLQLLKTSSGSIEFDPSTSVIIARFTGYMKSDVFKNFLNQGLDFITEKKENSRPILWLADTSAHKIQPESDTAWVAEDWNPRAFDAGLRHVAFILPESVFGKMSVDNYAKINDTNDDSKMNIGFFDNEDKAKNWFLEITNQLVSE